MWMLPYSDGGTGGARSATGTPNILPDQLTLFQPGEGRLYPPIPNGTPKVFIVRQPCTNFRVGTKMGPKWPQKFCRYRRKSLDAIDGRSNREIIELQSPRISKGSDCSAAYSGLRLCSIERIGWWKRRRKIFSIAKLFPGRSCCWTGSNSTDGSYSTMGSEIFWSRNQNYLQKIHQNFYVNLHLRYMIQ